MSNLITNADFRLKISDSPAHSGKSELLNLSFFNRKKFNLLQP